MSARLRRPGSTSLSTLKRRPFAWRSFRSAISGRESRLLVACMRLRASGELAGGVFRQKSLGTHLSSIADMSG